MRKGHITRTDADKGLFLSVTPPQSKTLTGKAMAADLTNWRDIAHRMANDVPTVRPEFNPFFIAVGAAVAKITATTTFAEQRCVIENSKLRLYRTVYCVRKCEDDVWRGQIRERWQWILLRWQPFNNTWFEELNYDQNDE